MFTKTTYKKKISVIVPVYNVELYLDKCLNSIVSQDFDDYEIVIVNDGSTDNSQKIIDKYVKQYPNLVKSFEKVNGGLSSARNYGIKNSIGKYLMFVDSDDYIDQSALKKIYNCVLKDDSDIVVYNYYNVKNGQCLKNPGYISNCFSNFEKYIVNQPSACNKLIRASIFKNNNIYFPEGRYYEDLGTMPILSIYANKISFLDDYLYYYVQRENSIMHRKKYNKKMEDIFIILDNISYIYEKHNLYNKYFSEIEYLYINHLLRAASIRFLDYKKYDMIDKIRKIMKEKYPKFTKNNYFKMYGVKQKFMCRLLYSGHYKLVELLRK